MVKKKDSLLSLTIFIDFFQIAVYLKSALPTDCH